MKKKNRKIVGYPLNPGILQELEVFNDIPEIEGNFDPDGEWTQIYRIWRCHGYRKSGNQDSGFLRLHRTPVDKDTFTLNIEQYIVNSEFIVRNNIVEVKCQKDLLSTPLQWHQKTRFFNRDGSPINHLNQDEYAQVKGNKISGRRNKNSFQTSITLPFTADWCLFEAVQRFPFKNQKMVEFAIFEGFRLLKSEQRIKYRGKMRLRNKGKEIVLHGFEHIGRGILPYEYWIDQDHRLIFAITSGVAYILDEQVEVATYQAVEKAWQDFRQTHSEGGQS